MVLGSQEAAPTDLFSKGAEHGHQAEWDETHEYGWVKRVLDMRNPGEPHDPVGDEAVSDRSDISDCKVAGSSNVPNNARSLYVAEAAGQSCCQRGTPHQPHGENTARGGQRSLAGKENVEDAAEPSQDNQECDDIPSGLLYEITRTDGLRCGGGH